MTQIHDVWHRPLTDLRISVTDRCNFRCVFCMPPDRTYRFVPRKELLTYEEIERVVRILTRLGVRKIRLTGGEPLLRRDIERLISRLAGIPGITDLALTTNGVLLADRARALREAGLHRVTVSLHSLRDDVFGRMNGRGQPVDVVLRGIRAAIDAGLHPVKVNVVVIRGVNDDEIVSIARFFKAWGVIVRFIEYMDVGTVNDWSMDRVVPATEIVRQIHAEMPLEPIGRVMPNEVAERYRYRDDGLEIGVIASVTRPFCRTCTRLRLSAQGQLYTCLFASVGFDLRARLRSGSTDDEIAAWIRTIWTRRKDRYSEERMVHIAQNPRPKTRVEMFEVGG